MAIWQSLLASIRRAQIEIQWLSPGRNVGLTPNPRASERSIAATERRLGRPLPPSYRAFLGESDGWPKFFDGASLLGTAQLGRKPHAYLVSTVFEAAETPNPDTGRSPPRRRTRPMLIPFGVDLAAKTLFAFNPTVVTAQGEYEVISWVNEIGVRHDNFEDFLAMVLELCESELESLLVTHSAA